jgi:hypothetical protein
LGGHRQDPPAHPEQPACLVEHRHRIAEYFQQPGHHQVAHGVPGQRPGATEAMGEHLTPAAGVPVLRGQRGQRHPQVARREHPQLAA